MPLEWALKRHAWILMGDWCAFVRSSTTLKAQVRYQDTAINSYGCLASGLPAAS